MSYTLKKSNDKKHKYIVIMPDNKKIKFGAYGYSDFTKHKDIERKKRYEARHKAREDWTKKNSAGFWSKWILWNKPTLKESIDHTQKKFKIKIKRNF